MTESERIRAVETTLPFRDAMIVDVQGTQVWVTRIETGELVTVDAYSGEVRRLPREVWARHGAWSPHRWVWEPKATRWRDGFVKVADAKTSRGSQTLVIERPGSVREVTLPPGLSFAHVPAVVGDEASLTAVVYRYDRDYVDPETGTVSMKLTVAESHALRVDLHRGEVASTWQLPASHAQNTNFPLAAFGRAWVVSIGEAGGVATSRLFPAREDALAAPFDVALKMFARAGSDEGLILVARRTDAEVKAGGVRWVASVYRRPEATPALVVDLPGERQSDPPVFARAGRFLVAGCAKPNRVHVVEWANDGISHVSIDVPSPVPVGGITLCEERVCLLIPDDYWDPRAAAQFVSFPAPRPMPGRRDAVLVRIVSSKDGPLPDD